MSAADVEFVVVGAGVLGLSTARALARRGREVVVCEQDTVGHGAAGSRGSVRIFRLGYDEPGYVRLAMAALRLWRRLEAEAETELVTTTGQVTFGDDLDVLGDAMTEAGARHERMAADEVTSRFPALSVPTTALFEPESGVIAADDCLAALRRNHGVELRERTRVLRCDDDGGGVRVVFETPEGGAELRASVVIVCAGPWTAPLVSGRAIGLRAMPTLEQVAYLAPTAGAAAGTVEGIPVFVERRRPWFYGLPVRSSGLMKVSLHGAGPAVTLEELDRRRHRDGHGDIDRPDEALVAELTASARRLLPGLAPVPVGSERCVYDNSLDGDFVVDRIGAVVIGAGTSGHGFKFAPLLGELLADLATDVPHLPELGSAEDLGRFTGKVESCDENARLPVLVPFFRRLSVPARSRIPATLVATRLSFDRGAHTVLKDVSLTVTPTSCIGVVGPNGVGKSTFLQLLAALQFPDAGSVRLDPPAATVGYLTQEHEHRPGETVGEALYRRTGVADAEAELAAAGEALGGGEPGADERFAVALERYDGLSAADLDARISSTLDELGLPGGIVDQEAATLSGGQAARVALAAIVLSRFDITLLDEPTNDLDFDGLRRLEAVVAQRAGGMVLVSHDRAFLDATVTSVLELDEHDHSARLFGGGWSAYLEERATARRHAEENYAVNQSQRRELADRARRERQWATSAVRRERRDPRDHDKAQRDFRINRTEKLASRARQTERAIERLGPVDKPWEGWDLRFTIDQAPRAGAIVARFDGVVIERGDFRMGPISLEIGWAERIALVGPNGSGKTSFVEALLGRLPLAAGTASLGPSVVVGELGQDRRPAKALGGVGGESILDVVIDRCGLTVPEARSLLAKFGLGAEHLSRPRALLSPGERTRAELAIFQARQVNFLVLDEPTNHLDVPAVEQIEEALAGFDGTVLLVSHDRRLLDAVDLTRRIDLGAQAADRSRG